MVIASEPAVRQLPTVRLTMPAIAPNVAISRQVLAGLADALNIDVALCADMKIAVTEACTNVVLHAYPGGSGPIEVSMIVIRGGVAVSVRDRGVEFNPLPTDTGAPALKFGLSLIASLSDEFGIRAGASGTEVQMLFSSGDEPLPEVGTVFAETSQLGEGASAEPDAIVLSLGPSAPFVGVLGRLLSLLAARADFSIDRLSDAQLVSDALASHAPGRDADGALRLAVIETGGGFDLRVGPLMPGGGRALVADTNLPSVGPLLERLTDEIAFEPVNHGDEGAETLRLRMSRDS
jgi:anti-sigma regulatory factor (Ser/Thr protein kinase)